MRGGLAPSPQGIFPEYKEIKVERSMDIQALLIAIQMASQHIDYGESITDEAIAGIQFTPEEALQIAQVQSVLAQMLFSSMRKNYHGK